MSDSKAEKDNLIDYRDVIGAGTRSFAFSKNAFRTVSTFAASDFATNKNVPDYRWSLEML